MPQIHTNPQTTETTEPATLEDVEDSVSARTQPNPTGFEPPPEATKARYKRLNPHTGGWEDAPVVLDGYRTPMVDASAAGPNLPLAEYVPTFHRITWYSAQGKVLGYSKTWRLEPIEEMAGGASNTPRMWPPVSGQSAHSVPQGGYLSSADTLALLRGLSFVVHEAAAPMLAQIQQYAEATLARERAFHEARLAAEQQRHAESMARDRQFLAAMRDVQEIPRERRLAALEQQLAQEAEDHEQTEATNTSNGYAVAQAFVEHAPEIIRTVANEVRGTAAAAALKGTE